MLFDGDLEDPIINITDAFGETYEIDYYDYEV